jgi:ATP-dependent DNA helicase RecG
VPTVGGILLFGTMREERFPDAYLQAGRFAGRDRTRILDTVEFRNHLPALVDHGIAFLRKHVAVALEIGAARHRERWPILLVELREAIVNAILHADFAQRGAPIRLSVFDDRVEVENPGLLPFGLTVDDILAGVSKLRNRVIGRVFKELGLIEQWGSGIGRMRAAWCRKSAKEPAIRNVNTIWWRRSDSDMPKIDITKTELVWPGKYNEDGTLKEVPRVSLPFQVIETVNESRATREAQKTKGLSRFDTYEGK